MNGAETATGTAAAVDIMNQLAGLAPESPVVAVRALRPPVVNHTQGSYDTLLAPQNASGLTLVERAQVALRVAVLTDSPTLIDHYRQRLVALGAASESIAALAQKDKAVVLDQRTTAIMHHVDLLTHTPGAATPAALATLQERGLRGPEIVTLSQLIAFLSFQVRVLPVLSLLAEEEAA
ncbi:MAG: CMD domain protein [Caldilineaceae bacterium]